MKIYLLRHGNTFAPGDKVVWTGCNLDLPLVEKGREQAEVLAKTIALSGVVPSNIYCGPLIRTKEYAHILHDILQLTKEPIVDDRLNELDYGGWSGLTNDEVDIQFGIDEQRGWNRKSIWPLNSEWTDTEEAVISRMQAFMKDILPYYSEHDNIFIVSSNGLLRYFLKLIPYEFEKRIDQQAFKMKTGNLSRMNYDGERYKVDFWDLSPNKLKEKI